MIFRKLIQDIDPEKLKGLRIGTIGILVGISGAVLFAIGMITLGRMLIYTGFIVVVIGALVHTMMMIKDFFKG